jgi:2-amino-4-hydroxy-6-hydroxymethyldihydropteridine diphosphokinase
VTAAYLSLGCNVGDCCENLTQAVHMLNSSTGTRVIKISSLYRTEPVGYEDQPDFLNIAVEVETELTPPDLHSTCRLIESELGGRAGRRPMGPRSIDIDILLFGEARVSTQQLQIPHPRMLARAFVLVPLAEIAPEAAIPGQGTVAGALAGLEDSHSVEKLGALIE